MVTLHLCSRLTCFIVNAHSGKRKNVLIINDQQLKATDLLKSGCPPTASPTCSLYTDKDCHDHVYPTLARFCFPMNARIAKGASCRLLETRLSRSKHAKDGGDDTHDTGGARDVDGVGGARGSRRGAATAARVGAGGQGAGATGVRLGALAGVGTLDDIVAARQGAEVVAGGGDVVRGLEVEGTLDILKVGELNAGRLLVRATRECL